MFEITNLTTQQLDQKAMEVLVGVSEDGIVKDADNEIDFRIMGSREHDWTKAQRILNRLKMAGKIIILDSKTPGCWKIKILKQH